MSYLQKVTQTDLLKVAFVEMMKDVCTSTPGHILAFTAGGQIAQVQIGIMRVDVNGQTFAPPPLIEVPVYFAGGSKFMIEHQLDAGDEGIVLFSQRCIDGWFNTGGVGENPIGRFHDYADAMFLPGMRSQPNAIKSFANNGIRMRDAAGASYIWLKNDGTVEIKADAVKITSGTLTHNNVNVGDTHTHVGNFGSLTSEPIR